VGKIAMLESAVVVTVVVEIERLVGQKMMEVENRAGKLPEFLERKIHNPHLE
jgi:hypothetical protein